MKALNENVRAGISLALFAVILILVALGNFHAPAGSIMENPITDPEDPYRAMDAKARALFDGTDPVRITLAFPKGIADADGLANIRAHHEYYERMFAGSAVYSLANMPHYHLTEEELRTPKYTDGADVVFAPNGVFNITRWKERVSADGGVFGKLIARDFSLVSFFIFPPVGQEEMETFRQVVAALESKPCSASCIFFKSDIYPRDPDVGVAGWVVGRGIINGGLHYEILKLVSLGILLAWFAFYFYTRSARQALLASVAVVGVSVFAARGSIGLLHLMGFGIKESIFMLLAYAAAIVQSTSFSLRFFAAYNSVRREYPMLPQGEVWRRARERVARSMLFITVLAVAGFGSLYTFSVSSIREMGIVAAIGAVNAFVLAVLIVPALHRITGGESAGESGVASRFERLCGMMAMRAVRFAVLVPIRFRLVVFGGGMMAAAGVALCVALFGGLAIGTKPLELTRGTIVERTADALNKEGASGFDAMQFFVIPARKREADTQALHDYVFVVDAWAFARDVQTARDVREVGSVLHSVAEVSLNGYGRGFPTEERQLSSIMSSDIGSLDASVRNEMYNENGFRLSVFTPADSSRGFERLVSGVLEIAQKHTEIRVLPFGPLSQYPWVDNYIILGKPLNVAVSQAVVIALYILWLYAQFGSTMRSRYGVGRTVSFASRGGVVMSVPLFFASAAIILLMEATGIPLDIATACIGALAINAACDFSVYMTEAYYRHIARGVSHEEALMRAAKEDGGEVVGDALLNVINFLPLLLSVFPPIVRLGGVMIAMLFFAVVGALVVMPALLHLTSPKAR